MTRTVGRLAEKAQTAAGDAAGKAEKTAGGGESLDPLKQSLQHLAGALTERAVSSVSEKVSGTTERLTDYAEGQGGGLLAAVTGSKKLAEGKSPLSSMMSAGLATVKGSAGKKFEDIKEAFTGGKSKGKGKKLKLTNIVEYIDVGVPLRLAYDQWTQFGDFPTFMKKVEQVEQKSEEKLAWTAKVFWSRRQWESTIVEQTPDEHIIWRSKGAKGYIDGAVTFHELAPALTRIVLVLEYHPQGLFEKTGNIWRAQGRRARLELKHFQRHVMTQSALHPDEVEGWRGEIHDGEFVEGSDVDDRDEDNDEPEEYDDGSDDEGAEDEGFVDDDSDEDEDGAPTEDDGEREERARRTSRKRGSPR